MYEMVTLWSRWRGAITSPAKRSHTTCHALALADTVAQLAEPDPMTKVAALRTLEALGQEHSDLRQGVVDVFCAYLRRPADGDDAVRNLAQQIVRTHLRPTSDGATFWAGIALDLTNAVLRDFDLSGCRVDGGIDAAGARFLGGTTVRAAHIGTRANWRGATFCDQVWMDHAVFAGMCRFDAATFHTDAWFGEATFVGYASFATATFGGHAWFGRCEFRHNLDLGGTVCRRSVGFRGAILHNPPRLTGTTFLGSARVSRRGVGWNVVAPGWRVVVDDDNAAVGNLVPV